MKQQVLIVAKGTYGDIFPLFAIALELQRRGYDPLFATDTHNTASAKRLGLRTALLDTPLAPNRDDVRKPGVIDTLFDTMLTYSNYLRMFRKTAIECEYYNLLPLAEDADIIIGNQQAYGAAIVKEKLSKPWIYCVASPVALLSSYRQSTLFPGLHWLQSLAMHSHLLQRFSIGLGRSLLRLGMYNVVRLRRYVGVASRPHPAFEAMFSQQCNLLLASPRLFDRGIPWPSRTHVTGYAWFEPDFMRNPEKEQELEAFLSAGPPPVVFTLGGNRRIHPGSYFTQSIEACRILGRRCIIVAASRFHDAIPRGNSVHVTGYLPYSLLFRNAAAVVHSGGIGTIGLSMRYGIPSLLVPFSLDQFDNTARAVNSGFARMLPAKKYRAKQVAKALETLLKDKKLQTNLHEVRTALSEEHGVANACDAIEAALRSRS